MKRSKALKILVIGLLLFGVAALAVTLMPADDVAAGPPGEAKIGLCHFTGHEGDFGWYPADIPFFVRLCEEFRGNAITVGCPALHGHLQGFPDGIIKDLCQSLTP